jgi:hypothetical protein
VASPESQNARENFGLPQELSELDDIQSSNPLRYLSRWVVIVLGGIQIDTDSTSLLFLIMRDRDHLALSIDIGLRYLNDGRGLWVRW